MLMNKTLEKDTYQNLPCAMLYPHLLSHSAGVRCISENLHLWPLHLRGMATPSPSPAPLLLA